MKHAPPRPFQLEGPLSFWSGCDWTAVADTAAVQPPEWWRQQWKSLTQSLMSCTPEVLPSMSDTSRSPFKKLLVANRSEIAIRVFRSAYELGIRTVAIYSHEDRFALHRFKADEAYRVGKAGEPIRAYLDIPGVVQVARDVGVDAIHPGYGFLSENAEFARACVAAGITFVGPRPEVLTQLGDKVTARGIAKKAGVPVL